MAAHARGVKRGKDVLCQRALRPFDLVQHADDVLADVYERFANVFATKNPGRLRHGVGLVEFIDVVSGRVLRSPRETVQPNRVDVEYWASGLGAVYLEGCLHRALDPRSGTSSHRSPGSDRGP